MIITDQSVGSNVGEFTAVPFHAIVKFRVESIAENFVIKAVLLNDEEVIVGWRGSMSRVLEDLRDLDSAEYDEEPYMHMYDPA
jgi:hypothetical protein